LLNKRLGWKDLYNAIGDSVKEPIAYLINNSKKVWSDDPKAPTDGEVTAYGKNMGTVVQMAVGGGAGAGLKVIGKVLPKLADKLSKAAEAAKKAGKGLPLPNNYNTKSSNKELEQHKSYQQDNNKKNGGCNCFTAGTKVLTDEGEKNIEDIEVGDKVLAKDENNPDGELAYMEVTALYRNQRDDIIKLHVGEQVIETTDNHPFWVEGKGWVFADELQVGDKLQKADGSNLTIEKVEFVKLDVPVTVYNFTVVDFHTMTYAVQVIYW
jgi:hypothetical protein